MRGNGIGQTALSRLPAEVTGQLPLLLEVEPESTGPMAARRINFYRRCGFTDFPQFPYVQPPYSPGLPPVPLTLMSTSTAINLTDAADTLRRRVYNA